jgi:hypothetical protein
MFGTNNGIFDEVNLSNMGPDKEHCRKKIGDLLIVSH